jgi:hypothetical protein
MWLLQASHGGIGGQVQKNHTDYFGWKKENSGF